MALTRDVVFWNAFDALTQHSLTAVRHLREMFEQPERSAEIARKIKDLEHQADRVTHEVVQALHQTWITPLDREEIHALATGLDDILDFIDAGADRFALYEIRTTKPEALALQAVLEKAVIDVQRAVEGLRKITSAADILALCRSINGHEHDADGIYRTAMAAMFRDRADPLDIMMWREVLDAMETATDRAEDVANIVEGIILEHS